MNEHADITRVAVQHFYDSNQQRDWERAERHRTEFAITLRALAQHLPTAPCRVFDCGGGPGRPANELARLGNEAGAGGAGGGGGGGGMSRPMGYIRIDQSGAHWEPLTDFMRLSMGAMFLVGWIVFWLMKTIRACAKRR